jgi:hypothetical protein
MNQNDNEYWTKRQLVVSLGEMLDANRSTSHDVARDDAENALIQLGEKTARECEAIALQVDALSRGNIYSVIQSVRDLVAHVAQGFKHDFTQTSDGAVILHFKSKVDRDKFLRNVPVAGVPAREELKAAMLERLLKQA